MVSVKEESPTSALTETLRVIEGVLAVDTDDWSTASVAAAGFRYLLTLEFSRQQPALALLYELDFQILKVERGSYRFLFKLWVKLKKRVATELKKADAVAIITAALAIPPAVTESIHIYERLFPPVQAQLQRDLPHCSLVIEVSDIRAPDGRDTPDPKGGRFEL
jgi:hypothetical protein